jgi:glycosyltransferase involved in cell wall biosynthesis
LAKIIWVSDAPSLPTGFGLVTAEICCRLAKLGHNILILGWWAAGEAEYDGCHVLPCPIAPKEALATLIKTLSWFLPEFLITLGDIPWLTYVADESIAYELSRNSIKWIIYYPVDGAQPDGTLPAAWRPVLRRADIPITMSRFGRLATLRSGVFAAYIPHGCNTELFCPPSDKAAAKRRLGYCGKFVILSDARNHRRKLIPRTLDVIKALTIPRRDVIFHLHSNISPQEDVESYLYSITKDLEVLGLECVTGLRQGSPPKALNMRELAELYAAADVYLLTSYGEGFGLPTLQAASSGVVAVVPANSASVELVNSHGFAVVCDSTSKDEFGLVRGFISRRAAARAVDKLYFDPELLRARSEAARSFALGYSWENIVTEWDRLLNRQQRVNPKKKSLAETGKEKTVAVQTKKLTPTGHDESVLPPPTLRIPVRLELRRKRLLAVGPPCVLLEGSHRHQLQRLGELFPGIRFEEFSNEMTLDHVEELVARMTLVVGPEKLVFPCLDVLCALSKTSYLGKSRFWSSVPYDTLLLQARHLLTDHAYSETRAMQAGKAVRRVSTRGRRDAGVSLSELCDKWSDISFKRGR